MKKLSEDAKILITEAILCEVYRRMADTPIRVFYGDIEIDAYREDSKEGVFLTIDEKDFSEKMRAEDAVNQAFADEKDYYEGRR